jgi:hypothetical protein
VGWTSPPRAWSSCNDYQRIRAAVRQSTPKLRLSPEGWTGALWAALRLSRDVQVGQEVFDKTFLVDAGEQDAARAFTPELCDALVRVAEIDVPSLVVQSGQAIVRLAASPSD